MDNVIRPDFRRAATIRAGKDRDAKHREAKRRASPAQYVKSYGEIGHHAVSLVRERSSPQGDVYKVVIDSLGGRSEPVGVEPATPDGLFDADLVGMAVVRTLEILAQRSGDFDVA
ncbi:hypothetical protein [Methylobacterium nonmethylotrophicum]|uniref:Uncharacterized protein n=1 Tax=Methylobacterium nonmethylotrophicum TaxID=1141884 RepID=A0A4Z0NXH0_9HYPH|nr:hypothetical protein [Methylobacterium nonmethylotrophicum]TGE02357.1 hypothetical protein EU555_00830 [Methylobacterium nonmethylotrophicum]